MAVSETLAPEARVRAESIGGADLVIALPSCRSSEALHALVAELRPSLSTVVPGGKSVIVHPDMADAGPSRNGASNDADESLQLLPYPLTPVERYHQGSLEQSFRVISRISKMLGARACVVIGSDPSSTTAEHVRALAEPVLHNGYDLSLPAYTPSKYQRLINSSIVHPLTRAIYGVRLQFPIAADAGLSARLADLYLERSPESIGPSSWITLSAIFASLQMCQVHLDFPPVSPAEKTDLSAALAQVLSMLFAGMESSAAFWQRIRGSRPVRSFGQPRSMESETAPVDVSNMMEVFQRGCKDLMEIWAAAISPATLVDLRKLARQPMDKFRMGDDLWVHVLYDFVLGHRQRVMNREHLLRSMTPIYLGWVASYALEVQNMTPENVEARLERLWTCFETHKPYLVSRWRWPDRFNP